MAFVETGRWQAHGQETLSSSANVLPAWASNGTARRLTAVILAVLVHLGVGALLLTFSGKSLVMRLQDQPSLTVINLSPPGMKPDMPNEQKMAVSQATVEAPASRLETPDVPVEWSLRKVRVAVAAPIAAPRAPAPAASASAGTAGAGTGGEGDYDPYAGASPRRRGAEERTLLGAADRAPYPLNPGSNAPPGGDAVVLWDEAIIVAARRYVARRFPEVSGIVTLIVHVAPGQKKARIEKAEGPIDERVLRLVRRLLERVPVRQEPARQGFSGAIYLQL